MDLLLGTWCVRCQPLLPRKRLQLGAASSLRLGTDERYGGQARRWVVRAFPRALERAAAAVVRIWSARRRWTVCTLLVVVMVGAVVDGDATSSSLPAHCIAPRAHSSAGGVSAHWRPALRAPVRARVPYAAPRGGPEAAQRCQGLAGGAERRRNAAAQTLEGIRARRGCGARERCMSAEHAVRVAPAPALPDPAVLAKAEAERTVRPGAPRR